MYWLYMTIGFWTITLIFLIYFLPIILCLLLIKKKKLQKIIKKTKICWLLVQISSWNYWSYNINSCWIYFKFYRWTFNNYFRYYNFLVVFRGASVISETFNIWNASMWYKNSRWTIKSSKFLEINRQISCYLGFCYNYFYRFFYDWFSPKKTRSTRYNRKNYSYSRLKYLFKWTF